MKSVKELQKAYDEQANARKAKIRQEPSKWKRFWKWVWYLISFPFVWLFYNIRDWRSAVIFAIVVAVVSSEVWVPALIGLITWGSDLSKWMFGVAGACWLFWLGPGTPFMVLCIGITIAIKSAFDAIARKRERKKQKNKDNVVD